MYYQYNLYLHRFYGQQQANIPQPMDLPMQQQNTPQMALNRQNILYGKQVDSLEVVKAIDIPLDGSISYFPLANGSAIVTKQLQPDGTSRIIIYKPVDDTDIEETVKFVTVEELNDKIKEFDVTNELKSIKRQLSDMQEDIEDMHKKIKK